MAEYAAPTIGRVLDVAVLTPEGTLVGAIEVRHRHACDDAKLAQLCGLLGDRLPSVKRSLLGDRWCEVDATAVVQGMVQNAPIPVATCASSVCAPCEARSLLQLSEQRTRLHWHTERAQELRQIAAELETAVAETVRARQAVQAAKMRQRLLELGGKSILTFGKYNGASLEALMDVDPTYVRWVARDQGRRRLPVPLVLAARRILNETS